LIRNQIVHNIVVLTSIGMPLEQDIKQERFSNEHEKAAINVLYTASWLHLQNTSRLKPFGITPEQFNVLRILRGSHPKKLMLIDITSRMIDKSSNATRLVEKLRQKGLIKREICESNRRQVDISINDKGLNVLKKIDNEAEAWLSTLKTITRTEAQELNRILDKIRK
jgi:DNA-binding MarR family transcriptional regulator